MIRYLTFRLLVGPNPPGLKVNESNEKPDIWQRKSQMFLLNEESRTKVQDWK